MRFYFTWLFSLFLLVLGLEAPASASNLDNIYPFSWQDTPLQVAQKLTTMGVETTADETTTVLDAQDVPFLGYIGQLHAEFSNGLLSLLQFTLTDRGSRRDVLAFYNDLYGVLKEVYGLPDGLDLSTRETWWNSANGHKSLLYGCTLQENEEKHSTTGTLQGTISMRSTHTVDGKHSTSSGSLDVTGVKVILEESKNPDYNITVNIRFENTDPGYQEPVTEEVPLSTEVPTETNANTQQQNQATVLESNLMTQVDAERDVELKNSENAAIVQTIEEQNSED